MNPYQMVLHRPVETTRLFGQFADGDSAPSDTGEALPPEVPFFMTIRTYIAGLLFSIASLGLLFPRSSAQSAPVTGLHVQGDSVAATSFPGADLGAEINAAIAASSIPVITVPIGGAISRSEEHTS